MTDAAFLKSYRQAYLELTVAERQLALCGITGQPAGLRCHGGDMPRGTNDATAAAIQRMDGMAEQVERMRHALQAMETRFAAILAAAWGFRERCILRQYYQLGQTDGQVAECLGVSVRHANRLRSDLLHRLDAADTSCP